jgi:hypothetical protein
MKFKRKVDSLIAWKNVDSATLSEDDFYIFVLFTQLLKSGRIDIAKY